MISQIIKNALATIENEKQQAVNAAKEKAMREKVIPFNAEADQKTKLAIDELTQELTAKTSALQAEFSKQKENIILLAEAKKKEYAEKVISAECAVVSMKYDSTVSDLTKMLKEHTEEVQ